MGNQENRGNKVRNSKFWYIGNFGKEQNMLTSVKKLKRLALFYLTLTKSGMYRQILVTISPVLIFMGIHGQTGRR
jgi:hypothetical protein